MKKINILLAIPKLCIITVFFLSTPLSWCQTGYLDCYPTLKGDGIISRVTNDGQYGITCYTSTHNISSFVVTNGNISINYPTSNYVASNPFDPTPTLNHGYSIRDMKIVGDTCWICGTYWRETGQWKYNMQGLLYWEILYDGFVGYVLLSDMINQSCPVKYISVPFVQYLNKLIVYQDKIAAIGEYETDEGRFVEITRLNDAQWNFSVGKTTCSEEQFKGITYTGGKVVVLSRFNDPLHVMYYKHGIGLRYGTLGSFLSTSQKIYCYSTRDADGTSDFDFWPTAPLIFDKANTTGSVVVGYICNPTEPMDQYRGRLVYYYFNYENDHHPVCIYNNDNKRYSSIKDFSYHGSDQTVALLEDSVGNSVFRFSMLQNGSYEKSLTLAGPQMMSVGTYTSSFFDMGIYAGGNYCNSQNKLSCLHEPLIFARTNSWNSENCALKSIGSSTRITCNSYYPTRDSVMTVIYSETTAVKTMKFYPSSTLSERVCTDLN